MLESAKIVKLIFHGMPIRCSAMVETNCNGENHGNETDIGRYT